MSKSTYLNFTSYYSSASVCATQLLSLSFYFTMLISMCFKTVYSIDSVSVMVF